MSIVWTVATRFPGLYFLSSFWRFSSQYNFSIDHSVEGFVSWSARVAVHLRLLPTVLYIFFFLFCTALFYRNFKGQSSENHKVSFE